MSDEPIEVVVLTADGEYWGAWTYPSRSRAKRALRSAGLDHRDYTLMDIDKYRLLHGDLPPPVAWTTLARRLLRGRQPTSNDGDSARRTTSTTPGVDG